MKAIHAVKILLNAITYAAGKKTTGKSINGRVIVLDFNRLEGCDITDCKLIYFGFGSLSLARSNISGCTFLFGGPAASGLRLFAAVSKVDPGLHEKIMGYVDA